MAQVCGRYIAGNLFHALVHSSNELGTPPKLHVATVLYLRIHHDRGGCHCLFHRGPTPQAARRGSRGFFDCPVRRHLLRQLRDHLFVFATFVYALRNALPMATGIVDICRDFDSLDCHDYPVARTVCRSNGSVCVQIHGTRIGRGVAGRTLCHLALLALASLVCWLVGRYACQFRCVVESRDVGLVLGIVYQWHCRLWPRPRANVRVHPVLVQGTRLSVFGLLHGRAGQPTRAN
mmetsp:Transcript_21506/g.59661  ORF Transcript_21506/g.59661 Transcript_21506/m.59661 type:complete len:234 (+) Transcript_21506:534-1235(+)